jgi:hypothetical protein
MVTVSTPLANRVSIFSRSLNTGGSTCISNGRWAAALTNLNVCK